MNQLQSKPVLRRYRRVSNASNPGKRGGGSLFPVASTQRGEGPGRMRIPWPVQMGVWFSTPSG